MDNAYALPDYVLRDILSIGETLNSIVFNTEEIFPTLDVVPVWFDMEAPVGEFRYQDDVYIFYIFEETLKAITEGVG